MGLAQPAWVFMDDEASHLEFEQRYPCTGHFRRTRTPLRHAIARVLPVRSAWWLVQRHLQIGSNAAAALPLCVHAYQWTFVGMSSPSYIYFVMSMPTDWALPKSNEGEDPHNSTGSNAGACGPVNPTVVVAGIRRRVGCVAYQRRALWQCKIQGNAGRTAEGPGMEARESCFVTF